MATEFLSADVISPQDQSYKQKAALAALRPPISKRAEQATEPTSIYPSTIAYAQRERDKPRQGVVANILALIRSGAVGFIVWLDV